MAYNRVSWVDEQTPLCAENLNHMEDGIENAAKMADDLESRMKSAEDRIATCEGDPDVPAARLTAVEQALLTKAPAGYGLGGQAEWLEDDVDIDTILDTGFYSFAITNKSTKLPGGTSGDMICIRRSPEVSVQFCFLGAWLLPQIMVRKHINNAWGEWEWINPPMNIGVEYRTTERYMTSPVYVKLVEYTHSELLGNGTATTDTEIPHDISNFKSLIEARIIKSNYSFPYIATNGGFTNINGVDATNIILRNHLMAWNASTWRFYLKYTKA